MKKNPRIAIVGGGPGGLALACIARNRGLETVVFELDRHPLERPQGGSLDLHSESGLLALQQAGLEAEFRRAARYEDQGMRLLDPNGKVWFEESHAGTGDRPEIDRTLLRQILIDSLPADTIRWGHKLRSVEPLADGSFQLNFFQGETGVFDFVVGADGAWSRARPLLSSIQPEYTGVIFVELALDDVDRRLPEIARIVGRGKMFAVGNSRIIVGQRNGNGHVRVYLGLRVPEDWSETCGIHFRDPEKARASLAAVFDGWAPELLALIHQSTGPVIPRPLYALPVGDRWPHRSGITLLGDAAHLMSPFGGEGVNLAMLDAVELAEALGAGDWSESIPQYEDRMMARAAIAAKGAAQGLNETISEAGCEHVLQHFLQVMGA